MKKLILFIFLTFGLFDIVLISCCPDDLTENPQAIKSIALSNYSIATKSNLESNTSINSNEYAIKVNFDIGFASQKTNVLLFTSSAYALSCTNDIFPLGNKVKGIRITANTRVYDTDPNQILPAENFSFEDTRGIFTDTEIRFFSISEIINKINSFNQIGALTQLQINLNTRISTSEEVKFNLEFIFNDNTKVSATTESVKFI